MPSEPSPQCSKTCLLLTSHLCLDHPKHITKTDIHIYILIIFQCMLHVFLDLKGTVQLQSSSLCTFPHHLLLHPFWVRFSCSSLCPWTRSVYDFDLLYEPQPHINIKYHGVNIVLTAGFCCSVYEVFALLWSYTSWLGVDCIFFWDNLSIPSSRVKHQDPWKRNWQVAMCNIPKKRRSQT